MIINSNINVTMTNSFNNDSDRYIETDAYANILPWNIGAGHGVPNNHLHKGQSDYNCERELYDHLNSEFVNVNGMVGEYYVTTYDKGYNRIYGEDNNRRYIRKFDFMFYTDEMYEADYNNAASGFWNLDSNTLDVAKVGFLECSRTGSSGDKEYIDLQQGHTISQDFIFEEYQPKVGDYIKVKSIGLFYEITFVKNRYTSLQGTSFWQLTLIPMKEENSAKVSDELGMAEQMASIHDIAEQRKNDIALFDMSGVAKEEHAKIAYKDTEELIAQRFNELTDENTTIEEADDILKTIKEDIIPQPITANKNSDYDNTTAQDSINDGTYLNWD
jgi:hypothetical protein